MTPATAALPTTTGVLASPPLPMVRWDHLLLAMDVVSYLAQGPDQRGFSARAVNDVVWVRLGWLPRRGEAYDIFGQLIQAFEHLWTQRAPDGIEDHYNVAPFFEHLRLMPKTRPGERAADGFERLLRAIATGEVIEGEVIEAELCGGESVSRQPVARNDGGD